jgi:SMI1 / KNR4 family (SUKH-1)
MGWRTIFHQPATEEEIQDAEKKLGVELPQDYKEFLRISNGLEQTWNGILHQGYLGGLSDVEWSRLIWDGDDGLPLELVTYTELLPCSFDWPVFDLKQAISIHNPSDECNTWLVTPELVKQSVAVLFETFNGLSEKDKVVTKKVFDSYFGNMEALKEMEWAVVTWTHWGLELELWKTFKEFIETLVEESGGTGKT